ncbi:MAG: Matrixin [Chthoniobacteraceae bacterium]|nr:Matrixin [Chthoniobacteraceae bacterium]
MKLFLPHLTCAILAVIHLAVPANAQTSEKAVGTSVADFAFEKTLVAPLRIHLLNAAESPALSTTLTDTDITRILNKVNRVWSRAGIFFYAESVVREAPVAFTQLKQPGDLRWLLGLIPESSYNVETFNVYYIKEFDANGVFLGKAIFVKDGAALHAVEGGIDEPIPRVTSHELGHALSLPHRQDRTNLMASGTTGTLFNENEIALARERAAQISWIKPASELLAKADTLQMEGRSDESRALYNRLAAMPGESEPLLRIRRLATP